MTSWIEITALILAIIAIAIAVGLLIWYLVALGGQGSNTVNEVTGSGTTGKSGGGNLYFINSSTATDDFILTIESDSSATKGKSFTILNNGGGKLVASSATGSSVTFPSTTIAKGGRASFVLYDSNKYYMLYNI